MGWRKGGAMEEVFFLCPSCWQRISFVVDLSVEEQSYIEDCEVCCRPLEFRYNSDGDKVTSFDVELS